MTLTQQKLTRPISQFTFQAPTKGWTPINSGGQVIQSTTNGLQWNQAAAGANNLIGYTRPVSGNVQVDAWIRILVNGATNSGAGMAWQSASGQLVAYYVRAVGSGATQVENWNSPTSFSSGGATVATHVKNGFWMRLIDNGTNITCSMSGDGSESSYVQVATQGRTAFLTGGPTSVGWWGRDNNAANVWELRSWSES